MVDRIRIVVAESGESGDDRGAEALARTLRDAGTEVVYTGRQRAPEQIVQTAVQEDVDAIALNRASETLQRQVRELLAGAGAADVVVFAGAADEAVEWVRENVATVEVADTG